MKYKILLSLSTGFALGMVTFYAIEPNNNTQPYGVTEDFTTEVISKIDNLYYAINDNTKRIELLTNKILLATSDENTLAYAVDVDQNSSFENYTINQLSHPKSDSQAVLPQTDHQTLYESILYKLADPDYQQSMDIKNILVDIRPLPPELKKGVVDEVQLMLERGDIQIIN